MNGDRVLPSQWSACEEEQLKPPKVLASLSKLLYDKDDHIGRAGDAKVWICRVHEMGKVHEWYGYLHLFWD